jgi:hypothetical protein
MMKPFFMLPGEPFDFCRDHFHYIFLNNFSFEEELNEIRSKTSRGLNVKYPLFLSDFNATLIF